jgi:hypothetical protein
LERSELQLLVCGCDRHDWYEAQWAAILWIARMIKQRCAIYTRKSTEEGLEQNFNSLDAQREACAAYVLSQKHEVVLSRLRSGLSTHLCGLSLKCQGAFAAER